MVKVEIQERKIVNGAAVNYKELKKLKPKIIKILKKHGINKAGIFGSYIRGEQKKNSDIDILIEFNDSLLTLVGIGMELEKALNKRVDLLTYRGLSSHLKRYILAEEVRII